MCSELSLAAGEAATGRDQDRPVHGHVHAGHRASLRLSMLLPVLKGESEGSVDLEELPPLPFCLDEIRHPIAGCLPRT